MFGFKKKKEEKGLVATQDGTVIALSEVPDEAFSEKMLGDGAAIIPTSDEICSPVDGTIIQVTDTLHAYGIQSDDGLDILVHVGINTVELKGEGFTALVKEGDKVKAGDVIAKADLSLIKSKGYETHTPILITNMDDIKEISFIEGSAQAGKTVMVTYSK